MEVKEFIEKWKNINLTDLGYVFEGDSKFLDKKNSVHHEDYNKYIKLSHSNYPRSNTFHLGLYPQPFAGDLVNAQIFILLLNPGFLFTSYYEEHHHPDFKQSLKNTLKQDLDKDFPFMWLNPKFLWTSGGQYWFRKLRSHLDKYRKENKISYYETLSFFSKKIAVLQLYPYHSEASPSLSGQLESTTLAKKLLTENLLHRTEDGNTGIIVTRQSRNWGVENESENLIIYNGNECRGANLGINIHDLEKSTRGGKLIQKIIKK
jgi:hypothetical protein